MMNLLSHRLINRATFLCLFAIAVVLFLALPVPSSLQSHESVIGPSVAWAGSPDETLNPPPNPPKRCAKLQPPTESAATTGTTLSSRAYWGRTFWGRTLISVLWRMNWASLRF